VSDAAFWIARLGLRPHPEGGFFRETYRAADTLAPAALPSRFDGPRAASTAIYFLLTHDSFSALHRIRSDELWHFYAGDALLLSALDPATGACTATRLGADPARGETFQAVVPAGAWFGAEVAAPGSFALVGCTVAPGFEFADFELAERRTLLDRHPAARAVIERLTR